VKKGLHKALDEVRKRPIGMIDMEWEDLDAQVLSTIKLCLANDVLFNIVEETSTRCLWDKLETLYMKKSLTNKIYLKRKLYNL